MRLLLALLLLPAPLLAQEEVQCTLSDTPAECFHRFVPPIPPVPARSAAVAESATNTAVSTANTGLSGLVSANGSSLKDFLSLLSASLEGSSLSENGQALTFDWNPPLNGGMQPLKLQAVLADPKVSNAVSTALGSNAAAITALNDSLTNTDDVTVSGSYAAVNGSYGRSIAPHRTFFESLLFTALPDSAKEDDAFIVAMQAAGNPSLTTKFSAMGTDVAKQRATLAAVETASRAAGETFKSADRLTRAFAKLLNNQPQVYVSAVYHQRTAVAGPNEWIGKATYEYGFRNLNTFTKTYRAACDPLVIAGATDDAKRSCVDLLERYAGDTELPDAGSEPGRVAVSVEYHSADANTVNIPQYSLNLTTKSGHSLVASAAYGRVMMPRPDRKSGRIDVALSYENISNAAAIPSITNPSADIKDRWMGSITYTQKMSNNMSFPISLVYANHAAFLPNVDKKLTAHFGLNYKMPSK
jgi:hypothetical protein